MSLRYQYLFYIEQQRPQRSSSDATVRGISTSLYHSSNIQGLKKSFEQIRSSQGLSCLHLYSQHKGITNTSFTEYKGIVKSKNC